jgi:hypothetical protein
MQISQDKNGSRDNVAGLTVACAFTGKTNFDSVTQF